MSISKHCIVRVVGARLAPRTRKIRARLSIQLSFSEVFTYLDKCLENKRALRSIVASFDAKDPSYSASIVRVLVVNANDIIARETHVFQVC